VSLQQTIISEPTTSPGGSRLAEFLHANRSNFAVCGTLLAILIAWIFIFPQTGDGDAIMHYLNAHDGLWKPALLMGSWARVGDKIPLLIPAQFGITAARCTAALISIICAWQTIRLAEDLKLPHAPLAAIFLIAQPYVFTLAADTMTEIPLALGIVIAIRLWMADRILASCIVMGYLPTVRPEGFFLCALWAAMAIYRGRPWAAAWLGWGTLAWFIGCWIFWGEPTYFFREGWAWPADSLRIYGHGSFFAYVERWPLYCGPVLLLLFLAGINARAVAGKPPPEPSPGVPGEGKRGGSRLNKIVGAAIGVLILAAVLPEGIRENVLPWASLLLIGALAWELRRARFALGIWVFLLIFALHSVLWWRGWFASCGLVRILACAAPITAIVCLDGWNYLDQYFARWTKAITLALIAFTPLVYYVVEPRHQRIFPLEQACQYAQQHDLLASAPKIIFGDPMAEAALRLPPNPPNILRNDCDRVTECDHLLQAPLGSAGFWDNQHAQEWFKVSIDDLPALGYTILYRTENRPRVAIEWLEPASLPREQIYVVIRKDRVGRLPEQ
jgi:hypothetical protein